MAREPKKLEAELAKSRPAVDRELIRELARLLDETGLTEIEFERDGARVRVAPSLEGRRRCHPSRLASLAPQDDGGVSVTACSTKS